MKLKTNKIDNLSVYLNIDYFIPTYLYVCI